MSSGAIGVGLKRMELAERPKHLSGKQALAAIGQGRLIALWDNLFGQLGQPIAQILLTRGDISDVSRSVASVSQTQTVSEKQISKRCEYVDRVTLNGSRTNY